MTSATDLAAFIINSCAKSPRSENDLTHLKLQKLLYYCQGHHLALYGAPLFPDEIEAWEHGPVVRTVYNTYRPAKRSIISKPLAGDSSAVSDREKDFVREVLTVRGQFSAWRLREMTHRESPWVDAYVKDQKNIIPQASLKDFFSQYVRD